ncbi:3-deoxy-D-manno-octulosonic acid transferase [Enterovirga rhinocerotis]|uniref:3-deoxy-D-manno-octulosonic acid transferase n=1 Tax=Enterovirga rhinocerotis TaxID=1339210 RepID=A0A4V3DYT8_9HYPH|nr:3-deoxy-D-manno-octulosonic acid transferase [Enterovirga rhinocerotis]TDR93889.1 3-deoxy-D-manno-octulosonic-acid transferase [Enterovirga rhinocerotis]
MSRPVPAPLAAYRIAATLLSPLAAPYLRRRADRGKEEPERLGERFGRTDRPRPDGPLVWAHGASIGETQSLLPLIGALVGRGLSVLVTSGTRTSAEILEKRLPAGAFHQYLPLDVPRYVRRFLDHWQPSLALFAESEVWPNLLVEIDRRAIPLALVNGRLSARSLAGWQRAPMTGRAVFGRFTLCLAQSEGDAERLALLGAPVAAVSGNLKFDIPPLPADPADVEALAGRLAGRPLWMAASTHPGEEEEVVAAHLALRAQRPGLLTILAPRHPERGDALAEDARGSGLSVTRRSLGEPAEAAGDLHLVDTVGDLGLFYRIAPLVLMGGSLVPHGGQNPIEPARLGAAVLHGPHVANFAEIYEALDAAGGALAVDPPERLAATVAELLRQPGLIRGMARAGHATLGRFGGALARTLEALAPYLPPENPAGSRDPA